MESNFVFLCSDISRLFRKHFADSMGHAATGAQWRVLITVQRNPGITQGVLAEYLDVEPITACRMVDRLEQAKLIERRRDPRDRRVWQLYMTPAAEPIVAELRKTGQELLEWVTSDLSELELADLTKYLTKIRDKIVMVEERHQVQEISNG